MDVATIGIIVCFVAICFCYSIVYGWILGLWHPVRRLRLWMMRLRSRNCYNCRYLGYSNECYAWEGKRKYNYVVGQYTNEGSARAKHTDEMIGTKYCKWEKIEQ